MSKILGVKIKPHTIFVSIASYRDEICNSTIKSLYDNAKNPGLIFVGICQQNNYNDDIDCTYDIDFKNIKVIRIPYNEAKGPTYARYLCSTLWNGEEYYLQIDSHTSFVKNWDEKCINMINEIQTMGMSNKPVLSHYPNEIKKMVEYTENPYMVTRITKGYFTDREMISFYGAEIMNSNNQYYQTPFVAGGMFFCKSNFLEELPYDPTLDYLFNGEEILLSIRFYTNNWDVFTPKENIVFHEYTRSDQPKIWTDNPDYSDEIAFNKVKQYIKLSNKNNLIKNEPIQYGLGNDRTLEEYYNYAGIDIINKKVYKNFGRLNNIATKEDIENSNRSSNKINRMTFMPLSSGKHSKETQTIKISLVSLLILIILIYFIFNKNKK